MNRLIIASFTVALALANSGYAFAHANLASAVPGAGATVQTAPTEVSITFTEEVVPKFSSIQVLDAKGARVDQGAAQAPADNAKLLSIGLKALTPGVYKVNWRATAADDSHKTKGTFIFTYKP